MIANGRSSLLLKDSLHGREQKSVKRQLTELTDIFEPNDSCSDLVSFKLPLKRSKLGLCGCQLYMMRSMDRLVKKAYQILVVLLQVNANRSIA